MGLLDFIFGGGSSAPLAAQQPTLLTPPDGYATQAKLAQFLQGAAGTHSLFGGLGAVLDPSGVQNAYAKQQLLGAQAQQAQQDVNILAPYLTPGAAGGGGQAQPQQAAPALPPPPPPPPGMTDPTDYQRASGVGGMAPETPQQPPSLLSPQQPTGGLLDGLRLPPGTTIPQVIAARRIFGPGVADKMIGNMYPGPTDLARLQMERNAIAQQNPSDPRLPGYDAAILKASGIDPMPNLREGSTLVTVDPTTMQPRAVFQAPKVPEGLQVQYDPSGRATSAPVPGVLPQISAIENIKQGAIGQREAEGRRQQYQLETGERAPGAFGFTPTLGLGNRGGPPPTAGTPPARSAATAPDTFSGPNFQPPAAPGQPAGPMPNAPRGKVTATPIQPPPGAPDPGQMKGGELTTEKGTVIPSAMSLQTMGPGQKQTETQIANGQKVEANWNAERPNIELARQRIEALTNAFQQVETGSYTTNRAKISGALRGLGFPTAADAIMSQKDTTAVQSALWNGMQDVLQQLKVINSGTGGRILNSEFNAFMEHGFTPDMQPGALRSALVAQLGQTYQLQNMIDDYGPARRLNWRDASQYQTAYLKKNPIEGFVDYADKTMPQFKGMAPPPTPPKVIRFDAQGNRVQ